MTLYHIDTDMGVDDGLALVVADRYLNRVSTLSTVFGNVPVEIATRNAMAFRELLQRTYDWTVVAGAAQAADGFRQYAQDFHGGDGMGGAMEALEPTLLRRVSGLTAPTLAVAGPPPTTSPITLIGLGPATNIPGLVRWYGGSAIERIILMAGAFFDVGNARPWAEFNAYCDPLALQETLGLGIPVTFVPLDVCRKVQLSRQVVVGFRRAENSPLGDLIATSHMHYMDRYRDHEGIDGCFPHDSVAVLAAVAPECFYRVRGRVSVDRSRDLRGRTTVIPDESSHVEVVTGGRLKWLREALDDLLKGRRQSGCQVHTGPAQAEIDSLGAGSIVGSSITDFRT